MSADLIISLVLLGFMGALAFSLVTLTVLLWKTTRRIDRETEGQLHEIDCHARLGLRCNCYVGSE